MDRRTFLAGLFSLTGSVVVPTSALSQPTTLDWQQAVLEVFNACQFDLMMFGKCYYKYVKEFPYVKHIPLSEVYLD